MSRESLKKTSNLALSKGYLNFLEIVNPWVFHLFSHFTDEKRKVMDWTSNVCRLFREESSQPILLTKELKPKLFSRTFAYLRSKPETKILFKRTHDLLYEDIVLDPLGEDFFSEGNLPSRERLEHFRQSCLSTPMRLVLDLCFLEDLSISQISSLLEVSENMLEPFLLSLFHKLAGDIPFPFSGKQNSLEAFRHCLLTRKQSSTVETENEFSKRVTRLALFFSQDIRSRLSQNDLHIILAQSFPEPLPSASVVEATPESWIASIHANNKSLHAHPSSSILPASADSWRETPVNAKSGDSQWGMAKAAIFILGIFLCLATFRTLSPPENIQNSSQREGKTRSFSIRNLQLLEGDELGQVELPSELKFLYPLQKVEAPIQGARIELKNGIVLELSSDTKVRIHSLGLAELIWGEISILFPERKLSFTLRSRDGEIQSTGKNLRLAKWSRDFTVAGVRRGSLLASRGEERIRVSEGQEIRLGKGITVRRSDYSSTSFLKRVGRRFQGRSTTSPRETPNLLEEFDDEGLRERIMQENLIKSKPSVDQKDFLQKL
jgi:hypothetical protein